MMRRFIHLWVLLLCGLFTAAAFAQNTNSTIKGTVQDASGAVVPGATVTLTNVGTNQTLTTTSKEDGFYVFTNLAPANYKVTVTNAGFAQWVGVLTLRVSQDAEVSPKLVAASVTTQVTVHDVTPVIDRVNPTISDVKNATVIETIPVQNRNILNVLAFSPGVVANSFGGSGGGYTRVNGVPGGSLDYLVDGQTMTNRFTNELQSTPQPLPTFQEVKVITSNGDAQYGRPGLVELVTKSGTNHFHGQIFELNQNNILKAKSAFSGPTVNALNHNEYGGQIGGPVWLPKVYNGRDKTFFFFDYEGIRETAAALASFLLPPVAIRGGDFSTLVDSNDNPINIYDPLTTSTSGPPYTRSQFSYNGKLNVIPPNRLNPITKKIVSYLPAENINSQYWLGIPNYRPANEQATHKETLYTAKVDQLFGPNRLAMRYTYTSRNDTLQKSTYYILNPNVTVSGGHNGAITFTQVLGPNAINVARAGIQYNHNYTGPKPISPPITAQLGLPTYSDTVAWPGFYWYGNFDSYFYGIDRDNPKDYPDQTLNLSDTFSYNRGNHQLMFGFEFANYRLTTSEIGQPGGNYNSSGGNYTALQDPVAVAAGNDGVPVNDTGSAFADFLLGLGGGLQQNIYPKYHTRQTEYDAYVQDNWRASERLTLNLGLRYAYWTPFADASGRESTFDPNIPGGMVVYAGKGPLPAGISQAVYNSFVAAGLPIESAAQAHYPLSLWNMPKNDFQPRIGFAYQVDPKTVLRGGYGIYQWAIPLQMFQQSSRKNPPFSYSAVLSPGELPDGTVPNAAAAELEYPNAEPQWGGPVPYGTYMIGSPNYVLNTSNVAISQGGGFGIAPLDPNYKAQAVEEYNLSVARELPYEIGFQLSYIGNHAYHQLTYDPINALVPRNNCATSGTTNVAQCIAGNQKYQRAYPVFATSGGANQELYGYDGYSNTNELQAQVQRTFGGGLLVQAYFTWQRTLTNAEQPLLGIGQAQTIVPAALTPGYNLQQPLTSGLSKAERLRLVYANDPTLPTKTFSFNAHYELPFGRGKRYFGDAHGWKNALISGYNISPFFLWHSGLYFSPYFDQFGSGCISGVGSCSQESGRGIILAPGKTGILPKSQRTRNRWFDASIYDPQNSAGAPYAGQTYILQTVLQGDYRNNIPSNYMTGPGFNELDATVYKLTPITKSTTLDIEAQIFNVYNHQNLALPNNKGIISQPLAGSSPRLVQLQAKFIF